MKNITFIVLICSFLLGCTTTESNTYKSQLQDKTILEVIETLDDSNQKIFFIDEPPCSLYSINIISKKKLSKVELFFNNLPNELVFSEKCQWKIENYYNYIPDRIKLTSIPANYKVD